MRSDDDREGTGFGGSIAARVARLAVDATVATRSRMAAHTVQVGRSLFTDVTNHVSDEIRGVMGPLWRQLAEDPDVGDSVKPLLRALGNQRGQAWAWVAGTATGTAMGAGLMALITNTLNPATRAIIAAEPNAQLAPGDAAAADVRGLADDINPLVEAAYSGISHDRYAILRGLATRWPTVDETLALLNRGHITRDHAHGLIRRNGVGINELAPMLELRHTPLSPADLATMEDRGIISAEEGARIAGHSGVSKEDYERLALLAGEPPGIQDLIAANRRGIIDTDRLHRGIRQARLRTEWLDVIEKLGYSPMSTEDAANAVNQGHMTLEQGAQIAKWNGLLPEHFDTIIQNAGLPPGIGIAQEALNRGLIDDDEFRRMFLESRIKNRYIDLIRTMATTIIPQSTIRLMYRNGVYPEDLALSGLRSHGYTDVDARALLALERSRRHESTKELTKSEVLALYDSQAIDRSTAAEMLGDLGYDDDGIAWELVVVDLRRKRRYLDAAVSKVHSLYVAHRLDSNEAAAAMDELRVPQAEREQLMSLWDIERAANTRELTVAQVQLLLRRGRIDPTEAMDRFVRAGYTDEDASHLVALAAPAPR